MIKRHHSFKIYDLFMYIYFFLVLGYTYNTSLFPLLPANGVLLVGLIVVASICLILANVRYLNRRHTPVLLYVLIISTLIIFRNGDIAASAYTPVIFTIFTIFSIYFLSFSNRWHYIALKVFSIFIIEHIIGTFFSFLFPDFYQSHILPLFPDFFRELSYQFSQHQIAGITSHYSKNALYLISGLLIYTPILLFRHHTSHTKRLAFLLSINFIALLLTGKRAVVIIYLGILITMLICKYRHHLLRFTRQLILVTIFGTVSIVALSNFIPTIGNSFIRAYEALSDQTSMDTRNILYDIAIDEFHDSPITGIGWNNYKYIFATKATYREREQMTVHNIYLQILCETGIIGGFFIYILFIILLLMPLKDILRTHHPTQLVAIYIFLAYHLFFLTEGVIGNSLYDLQTYVPYSIALAMYLYYHYQIHYVAKHPRPATVISETSHE